MKHLNAAVSAACSSLVLAAVILVAGVPPAEAGIVTVSSSLNVAGDRTSPSSSGGGPSVALTDSLGIADNGLTYDMFATYLHLGVNMHAWTDCPSGPCGPDTQENSGWLEAHSEDSITVSSSASTPYLKLDYAVTGTGWMNSTQHYNFLEIEYSLPDSWPSVNGYFRQNNYPIASSYDPPRWGSTVLQTLTPLGGGVYRYQLTGTAYVPVYGGVLDLTQFLKVSWSCESAFDPTCDLGADFSHSARIGGAQVLDGAGGSVVPGSSITAASGTDYTLELISDAVPEPGPAVLLFAGLACLAAWHKRSNQAAI
ncbi:MAG: hypothetical protein ABSH44_06360 [Bryobacteraceae bacterium]|jgi:hypothetical protein